VEIGVIGFGRFGKLLVRYLSPDFRISVFDKDDKTKEINEIGASVLGFSDVCKKSMVIICVPISEFEKTLVDMKNHLAKNTLVVDVCSVKEYPVKMMKEILPDDVQILATHPMFGPDSASDSLNGRKLVLCKERINDRQYEKIKEYLTRKSLKIIETNPEEHDRQIANTLVLPHFIGRTLMEMDAKNHEIDTEGYKRLLKILGVVQNDTSQLFLDMNRYNRFAKDVRENFMDALDTVNKKIN